MHNRFKIDMKKYIIIDAFNNLLSLAFDSQKQNDYFSGKKLCLKQNSFGVGV